MSFSDENEGKGDEGAELFPETIPVPEEQMGLFGEGGLEVWWKRHWKGMPEFSQEDLSPDSQYINNFATPGDRLLYGEFLVYMNTIVEAVKAGNPIEALALLEEAIKAYQSGKPTQKVITPQSKSGWFPIAEIGRYANKRYISLLPDDGREWVPLQGEALEEVTRRANEVWFSKWGNLVPNKDPDNE